MEPKKLAMIFALAILLPLCIGLFVDAIYAEPKYENYCNQTFYPEYKQVIPNATCPDFSMTAEYQTCVNKQGNPIFNYDQNNCQIYDKCDLCPVEFQKVQAEYNRNLFFILAPIALIFVVLGIFLTIEYLGAGFMFGGLILLFYATMRYFSDMSKLLRAIVILVELLIILYLGYKKSIKNLKILNRRRENKKMKKGIIWAILGLIAIVAIIILLLTIIKNPIQVILEDGLIINQEACSKITGVANTKIIVIHQLGCTHCAKVLPILRELEQLHNSTFAYYDLAIDAERKTVLDEMNILPKGVPVVIANCKVIVGERTKEEYSSLLFPMD